MRLPAGLRAAIVDLDGTMVDTLGDFEAALNAVLGELRLPVVDRAFIGRTVGKGSEHLIRSTLAQVGGDPQGVQHERVHEVDPEAQLGEPGHQRPRQFRRRRRQHGRRLRCRLQRGPQPGVGSRRCCPGWP